MRNNRLPLLPEHQWHELHIRVRKMHLDGVHALSQEDNMTLNAIITNAVEHYLQYRHKKALKATRGGTNAVKKRIKSKND